MLAQRYPTAYDGIAAGAPALYLSLTGPLLYWPQQVMNNLGEYPYGCEIDAITAAAIDECDGLDGVVDGVVSDPDRCLTVFDPFAVVGREVVDCKQAGNRTVKVSIAAATVVNASWHGIVTVEGRRVWHGYGPGVDLSSTGDGVTSLGGVAQTRCGEDGTCVGSPLGLTPPWFELFLAKGDPGFNLSEVTHKEFDELVHMGRQLYRSALDTDDPDLSAFRDAGGKMVTWHGLVSPLFPHLRSHSHPESEATRLTKCASGTN